MLTLETERLILRPFTLDDVEGFFELGSTPNLVRYVGGQLLRSLDEARESLIGRPLRDYAVYGYGRMACIERATGRLIGFSGLKYEPDLGETDIGYRFVEDAWGKGYATEAATASLRDGRERLKLQRIVGVVVPENVASVRVLKKIGLVFERSLEMHGDKVDLYA